MLNLLKNRNELSRSGKASLCFIQELFPSWKVKRAFALYIYGDLPYWRKHFLFQLLSFFILVRNRWNSIILYIRKTSVLFFHSDATKSSHYHSGVQSRSCSLIICHSPPLYCCYCMFSSPLSDPSSKLNIKKNPVFAWLSYSHTSKFNSCFAFSCPVHAFDWILQSSLLWTDISFTRSE